MQNQIALRAAMMPAKHETAESRARHLGLADGLGLAAAPVFAIMALVSVASDQASPDIVCSAMQGTSLLGGMVPMYALMSAFHLAPWLRLISDYTKRR